MKRKFQFILITGNLLVVLAGFVAFTWLAQKTTYQEIIRQATHDNKVIGQAVLDIINHSHEGNQDEEGVIKTFRLACDDILLPNKGHLCLTDSKGNLLAYPNLPTDVMKQFNIGNGKVIGFNESDTISYSEILVSGQDFEGYYDFPGFPTDIITSSTVKSNPNLTLMVHQNNDELRKKAESHTQPLILVGILVAVLTSVLLFVVSNRIIAGYENQLELKNKDLETAFGQISEQQTKLTSSISYAQRIQEAVLPDRQTEQNLLKDYFVFYRPRDIVSGDFYRILEKNGKTVVFAADSTGHGVPGAFMSLIGSTLLDRIVEEKGITSPELILKEMHSGIGEMLKQQSTENRDGMDASVCVINKDARTLCFSGAKNPLYYFDNEELKVLEADRLSIGGVRKKSEEKEFTKKEISLDRPVMLYLFSDGFRDQFGGSENRKFMGSRFKDLLTEIKDLPTTEQKEQLAERFDDWKGNGKQTDDVMVIGLRIDA